MPIIKTLAKAKKLEKEKFKIPRSVQEAIPIQRVWEDGIFQLGNRFSKSFSFTDINYAIAGKEDKTALFLDYSELLNALDSGASAKITIHNRRVNKADFEKSILLPMKGDSLDHFRQEYNQMLLSKVTGVSNGGETQHRRGTRLFCPGGDRSAHPSGAALFRGPGAGLGRAPGNLPGVL